jgi:hypothetical protein
MLKKQECPENQALRPLSVRVVRGKNSSLKNRSVNRAA